MTALIAAVAGRPERRVAVGILIAGALLLPGAPASADAGSECSVYTTTVLWAACRTSHSADAAARLAAMPAARQALAQLAQAADETLDEQMQQAIAQARQAAEEPTLQKERALIAQFGPAQAEKRAEERMEERESQRVSKENQPVLSLRWGTD